MAELQTKQQKRAEFALEEVKRIIESSSNNLVPEKITKKIIGMPNMILSNGLGQTLVFLLSKRNNGKLEEKQPEEVVVFNILKNFFSRKDICKLFEKIDISSDIKLLGTVNSELDSENYIKIQDETLRMLEWLKRYARAFSE